MSIGPPPVTSYAMLTRAAARVADVARGLPRPALVVAHDDRRNEAVAAAVRGADHALGAPVVADRLARGLDAARQRRLAHEPVAPDVVEQLFLRHDAVAVLDEVAQHVEHLGLDVARLAPAAQLEARRVELELVELEDHPPMMACGAPGRRRPSGRRFSRNPPGRLQDRRGPVPHRAHGRMPDPARTRSTP